MSFVSYVVNSLLTDVALPSIESFFDLVPNLPRTLHRARLLARMALPPTHSNFPHPSLIHAICAAAAARCPEEVYSKSTRDKQWAKLGFSVNVSTCNSESIKTGFGLRQAMFAKEAVQEGLNTGDRLFDVVRAMVSNFYFSLKLMYAHVWLRLFYVESSLMTHGCLNVGLMPV